MKENLRDFVGGFANQEENAEEIRRVFKDTGYLIDTHTGVASAVYRAYRRKSADETKTVIASTASPYKFSRSVMEAVCGSDERLPEDEFELIDRMEQLSGVPQPMAVKEIRDAAIRHSRQCSPEDMQNMVRQILK